MADIFDTLRRDHEGLKRMLQAPNKGIAELLSYVSKELPASLEAEDTVFYTPLERSDQLAGLIADARGRQRKVRTLSLELLEDIGNREESEALVQKLSEAVTHHLDEEEGELFDKARGVLSREQIMALGAEFDRQKVRVEGRLTGARPY